MRIDIGADDEGNDVEERNPSLLRQELLRKCQGQWGSNPGNFHNWHETSSNSRADLVESLGTSNDCH